MQSHCREPPSPERDLPSRSAPEVILPQGRPGAGQRQDPHPRHPKPLGEVPAGCKARLAQARGPSVVGPRRWRLALTHPVAGAEPPRASERGSPWGGRHAASLRFLHQIISYLQTPPPRQSPLTSFTQPERLETTAADVWCLALPGILALQPRRRRARLHAPAPKKPFYNPNLGAPHTETSCFLHRSAAACHTE